MESRCKQRERRKPQCFLSLFDRGLWLMVRETVPSQQQTLATNKWIKTIAFSPLEETRGPFSVPFVPHSQQTVSIPTPNRKSFSAVVKSLPCCRDPLGCCQCIGFHSTTSVSLGTKRSAVLGHFGSPQCDEYFGKPQNAGGRTPVPVSGALLHGGFGGCISKAARQ